MTILEGTLRRFTDVRSDEHQPNQAGGKAQGGTASAQPADFLAPAGQSPSPLRRRRAERYRHGWPGLAEVDRFCPKGTVVIVQFEGAAGRFAEPLLLRAEWSNELQP